MRNECSNGHPLRWFVGDECPDCGRDADMLEDDGPCPGCGGPDDHYPDCLPEPEGTMPRMRR